MLTPQIGDSYLRYQIIVIQVGLNLPLQLPGWSVVRTPALGLDTMRRLGRGHPQVSDAHSSVDNSRTENSFRTPLSTPPQLLSFLSSFCFCLFPAMSMAPSSGYRENYRRLDPGAAYETVAHRHAPLSQPIKENRPRPATPALAHRVRD